MAEDSVPAVRRGRGRPEAGIDLIALQKLKQIGCSDKEIAALFGVSERTITNRKKDPDFRAALEKGDAMGLFSIRKKQMDEALAGNTTMLIWLGKQRLGQKDKIQTEDVTRQPLAPPKIHVHFVTPEEIQAGDGGERREQSEEQ